jgi:hypothetical protein
LPHGVVVLPVVPHAVWRIHHRRHFSAERK